MAGIPESVATNFVQRLVDRAIDEAYYLCCFKKIAEHFEEEKKTLEAKRRDVQKDIEENTNAVKEIVEEVKLWEDRATGLIAEDTKTKKSCFYGWCRNCIWQYRRGRDLAEKTQKIKALVENSNFAKIGRTAELPGLEYYSSPDFVHFDSRKLVYGKLLEALKNDDSYKIALQGMGGSGKTTMVIEVGEKVEKEKLFDKVILVVVSNNPDVKKIQDEIAGPLGLKFKQEENNLERAKKLWLRLTNGEKILIILDDVWEKLKFEDIGIPLYHNHKGCHVLLTTRNLSVCRLMGCQDSTIQLDILSGHEAWDFFKKHSGINDNSPKKLKDTAEIIAKECKGLPVALAAVASTLKKQPLKDWNAALKSLRNPRPIDITDHELKEVYKSLEVSYAFLKNERAQELFKLCSLFPEDYEIPLEDLTRFAIGLGLFGEIDSYTTARDDMHRAKKRLIESCLLMEADEGRYVKMHDLVRDVAKLMAKNEIQLIVGPRWNLVNIEKQMAMRYLYCQNMIDFPERLSCPKLEILLVSIDKKDSLEVPEAFFEGMSDLKVLALWRRDWWSQITLKLPLSIEFLKGLRTLCLKHLKFEDISALKKLQRLETLELIRCFINELPNEIMELDKLRLLKLEDCKIERNPFEVIGRLFQIEELHFVRNFGSNWEFTGELVADLFDKDNISPELQRYRISLESAPNRNECFSITNSVSKGVGIEQFLIESISNTSIKYMIQRAEYLGLKKIQGGYRSFIPTLLEAIGGGMNELTELVLDSYYGMEYLIDTTSFPSLIGNNFSELIKLQLKQMCDLKKLCHGHQTPPDLFGKLQSLDIQGCSKLHSRLLVRNLNLRRLEKLYVEDCPKLTSLFTFSTAQSLVKLKQLRIRKCKELKYIITEDREEGEEIVQDQKEDQPLLPVLDEIILEELPILISIFPESYYLISFSPEDCPKARLHDNNTSSIITDGGDYQNHKNSSSILPKLKRVEVKNCSVLEFIFPASFFGNLLHLKSISIEAAPQLKYVFGQYQHEDNLSCQNDNFEIQIDLPALEDLYLIDLPEIISICPKNFYATWPPLKSFTLLKCPLLSITSISDFMVHYDTRQLDHITTKDLVVIVKHLETLEKIAVDEHPKIEGILHLESLPMNEQYVTSKLSYLQLFNLLELSYIFMGPKYFLSLQNLQQIKIMGCGKLKAVFFTSVLRSLPQLQYLQIEDCKELEQIIEEDNEENQNLSNPQSHYVCFPQLIAVIVVHCPKLKRLFRSHEFPKLELLLIGKTSVLEEVFGFEQCQIPQPQVSEVLPKLKYLILMELSSISNVCQGIDFRTVQYCLVHDCPKLNLPSTITSKNLLQHPGIKIAENTSLEFWRILTPWVRQTDFHEHILESFATLVCDALKFKANSNENPTLETTSNLPSGLESEVEAALESEPSSSQSQRIKETVGQCAQEDCKSEKAVVATTSTDSKPRNPLTRPLVKATELSPEILKKTKKEIVQRCPASEEPAVATSPTPSQEIEIEIPLETNTIKQTMDQEGSKLEKVMLKELSPQELAKEESMNETINKDQHGLGEMRFEIYSNDSKNDKQSKVELVQEESRKYTSMTEQQSIKGNVQRDPTPKKDKIVTSSSHSEPQNTVAGLLITSTQVIKETEKKNQQECSALDKPAMATCSTPSLSPSAISSNEVIEATIVTLSTDSEPRKLSAEPLVFPQELALEESRKYTIMTEQQSIQGDPTPEKDKLGTLSSYSESLALAPGPLVTPMPKTPSQHIKETEKKILQNFPASEKPAMATSSIPSPSPSAMLLQKTISLELVDEQQSTSEPFSTNQHQPLEVPQRVNISSSEVHIAMEPMAVEEPVDSALKSAISEKATTVALSTDSKPRNSSAESLVFPTRGACPQSKVNVSQIDTYTDKETEADPLNINDFVEDDIFKLLQSMEEGADVKHPALEDNLVVKALADLEASLKMPFKDIANSEANNLRLENALNFLSHCSNEDGSLLAGIKARIDSIHKNILSHLSSFKQASATLDEFKVLEEKEKSIEEELPQRKEIAFTLFSKISKTKKSMTEAQQKEADLKEQISKLQLELNSVEKDIIDYEGNLSSLEKQKEKFHTEVKGFKEEFEYVKKSKSQMVENQRKAQQKLLKLDSEWSALYSQFEQIRTAAANQS